MHSIQSETIGGTRTVVNDIKKSYLNSKYEFVDLIQEDVCGFNPIKACHFIVKYRKLINSKHADIIYICGLLYSGFLLTLAAKLSNVKTIVLSVHGSEWDKTDGSWIRKWLFLNIIEPVTVRMADAVFTVCKNELNNVAIKKGNKGNVVGVIYNSIPQVYYDNYQDGLFRTSINCPNNKILVAIVGRVVEDKGHKYIIDAINALNDSDFVFVIVGDGPYLKEYTDKCSKLINNNSLFLLGVRTDVFQILRDSDVFLFATLHENHSKSLLEAIMMKCAVICTNVGGNPEIVDESCAFLIPPRNYEAIISALKALKEERVRQSISELAFRSVSEKFSVANTLGKLDSLFERL